MEHILSLSYGKDSLACLGAIEQLGWQLGRIVHAEVWATDTIPADLPPMVEFKAKADRIIKERWGIEVEHVRSKKHIRITFTWFAKETEGKRKNQKTQAKFMAGLSSEALGAIRGLNSMRSKNYPVMPCNISALPVTSLAGFMCWENIKNPRLLKPDGMKPTAADGARKTTCSARFTPRPPVADAGSVTTRAWGSFGSCGAIIPSFGR